MLLKFVSFVAALALILALSLPIIAPGAPAPGATTAAAAEPHPAIRAAIRSLERARVELQNANHDFGGHRDEALEACNNAIKQLNIALQYDKR